jgi:hypothetical protein
MKYFPLLLLLPLLTLLFPLPTTALSSKTYSFNSQAAFNYTTTGPITYTATNATTAWYNPNWSYRQQITINKDYIGEELTDFPVLIRLDNTSLTGVRNDYHDLVLTQADGITEIPYEREDNTNLWVKVPKLTPTEDTVIYLYYGNPTVTEDKQRPEEVWTNGYAGVWHLNNNPEGEIKDSTENNNTGTANGGMNQNDSLKEGKVGGALEFDGSDDYVNLGNPITSMPITISVWFRVPDVTNSYSLISIMEGIVTGGDYFRIFARGAVTGDPVSAHSQVNPGGGGGSASGIANTTTGHQANTWHHAVAVFASNSSRTVYLDGGNSATDTTTVSGHTITTTQIGRILGNGSGNELYLNGLIDSVRISSLARSSSWISAEYANQANTDNFLTISPTVESHPSTGSGSTITLKSDRPLSYTSLTSFTPNGSNTNTYQLSSDKGKTWYYYAASGWLKTTTASSSANDITNHLQTFPVGLTNFSGKPSYPQVIP